MKRCLVGLALVVATLSSARGDELDQFRQREQILAQKWTREIAAALEVATRQAKTDPAGARQVLQDALGAVKNAQGLNDALRNDLSRQLSVRLSQIPATAAAPAPQALNPPRPGAPGAAPGFAPAAGGTAIPSTFAGSAPPAGGAASNPADKARDFIKANNNTLGKSADVRDQRAAGFSGTMTGVDNSAVPTTGDMTFSPNHKQIAANRAEKVNPKEQAVMSAMSSTISGDFTGMNFRQALDYITQKSGLLIIPDANSLKEAMVDYDDPVNFKISANISVRTALRKILGDRGLSYTINEGTVNVVTTARAREATVVRIYPILDLVTPNRPTPQFVVGPLGGVVPVAPNTFAPGTPGVGTFQQSMGQQIADMVRTSVDPQYWAPNGPGTIAFNEATGSLIVRASAEVHFMINGALGRR